MTVYCVRYTGKVERTTLTEHEASSLMDKVSDLHFFVLDGNQNGIEEG